MSNRFPESFKHAIADEPHAYAVWEAVQTLKRNHSQGMEDLKKLAERGSALSMFYLGNEFECGDSISIDMDACRHWYQLAASRGSIESCYRLACMDWHAGNFDKAAQGFSQIESRSFAPALYCLGSMHYTGSGFPKNIDKAYKYWTSSGNLGHIYALNDLSFLLRYDRSGFWSGVRGWILWLYSTFMAVAYAALYPASDRIRMFDY